MIFLDINCNVIVCANYLNYKNNRLYHIFVIIGQWSKQAEAALCKIIFKDLSTLVERQ